MSSTIVLGTDAEKKTKAIETLLEGFDLTLDENNPDLIVIEPEENKKSIGIAQTKQINKFINEKPYSHKHKAVVISRGELLTTQAQNALLKDLEEHPDYVEIVLGARTEKDVLETVLSRCKRIILKSGAINTEEETTFNEFFKMNAGERLDYVTALSKKEKSEILTILEVWINQSRENITEIGAQNVELLAKIRKDLEVTNVNTKLALEYLATGLN